MKRRRTISVAVLSALFLSFSMTVLPRNASASMVRFGGNNRYETSSAVSEGGWGTSDYVVIASGESYADALCAAPLAKKDDAPILLTESASLNSSIASEIKKLGAKNAVIVGGTGAVSEKVEKSLKDMGISVSRVSGKDRYETSIAVAKQMGTYSGKVVLASGEGYADALSVASPAASQGIPILLTSKNSLPDPVKKYVDDNKTSIKSTYVIGGEGVISENAASSMPSPVRLGGKDRYETNVKIMSYFKISMNFNKIYVVKGNGPDGNEYADALSASALASKTASPVMLVYNTLPSVTEGFIKANVPSSAYVIGIGGRVAVSDALLSSVQKVVSNSSDSASDKEIEELTSVSSKFKTIAASVNSENEKNFLLGMSSVIDKAVQSENLDSSFEEDMNSMGKLLENLSDSEQVDIYNKISGDTELMNELQDLKDTYGLYGI